MPRSWSKVSSIAKDVQEEQPQSDTDTDRFSIPLREPDDSSLRTNRRPRGNRKARNAVTNSPRWNKFGGRTSTPDGTTGSESRQTLGRRAEGARTGEQPSLEHHHENRGKYSAVSAATDNGTGNTRQRLNTVFDQLTFQPTSSAQPVRHLQGGQFLQRHSSPGSRPTGTVNQLPSEEQRGFSSPSEVEHVHPSKDAHRNPFPELLADGNKCEYEYTFLTLSTILAPVAMRYVHGTTLRSQTVISVRDERTIESTHSDLTNFRRPLPTPMPVNRPRYEVRHSLTLRVFGQVKNETPRLRMQVVLYDQTSSHTI